MHVCVQGCLPPTSVGMSATAEAKGGCQLHCSVTHFLVHLRQGLLLDLDLTDLRLAWLAVCSIDPMFLCSPLIPEG